MIKWHSSVHGLQVPILTCYSKVRSMSSQNPYLGIKKGFELSHRLHLPARILNNK